MKQQSTERSAKSRFFGLASELLPVIARKKAAQTLPVQVGNSYFYEVPAGWQADALHVDTTLRIVRNLFELESAFEDIDVPMIFVPGTASITKTAAFQVCRRHAQEKTVFFEVNR